MILVVLVGCFRPNYTVNIITNNRSFISELFPSYLIFIQLIITIINNYEKITLFTKSIYGGVGQRFGLKAVMA